MALKLTDTVVKELPLPEKGARITYDETPKGFGVRITKAGARAFVLNYRTRSGRERRYTIGAFPDWKTSAAREEAKRLKQEIDRGGDPQGEVKADRDAPTVKDLCDRFREEYLFEVEPGSKQRERLRRSTRKDYASIIDNDILPTLRSLKVTEVTHSDVDGLHRKISKRAPYRANRVLALLSRLFNLSVTWGYRADNPAKGVERNDEQKRKEYLKPDELARLTVALAEHEDQMAANIIRLLLLTGARRNEVQSMRWEDLDLEAGVWTKPSAHTKTKIDHRVPLSAPARQLLAELRETAAEGAVWVFPARIGEGHRVELKDDWADLCKAAKISGKRIHDLRHTYASVLASAGLSLPVIGALLGHTQPATTNRYAHLFDDPLREATERVAAIVTAKKSAEVVPWKGRV